MDAKHEFHSLPTVDTGDKSSRNEQSPSSTHSPTDLTTNTTHSSTDLTTNKNILKTISLYSAFFALGFQACIFGSAAVDLQHLYSVSTTRYSFAITLHSIMYMLGGGLLGVFYDRINPQLQLGVTSCISAVLVVIMPLHSHFTMFLVVISVFGLTIGYVEGGAQPYCLSIWSKAAMMKPVLQGLHFIWSVGAALGPFVLQPFLLPDLGDMEGTIVTKVADDFETTPSLLNNLTINSTHESYTMTQETNVRIGFIAIGLILIFGSAIFFASYGIERKPVFLKKKQVTPAHSPAHSSSDAIEMSESCRLYLFIMTILSIMFACSLLLELILTSFFPIYAVKRLAWSSRISASLNSVLWGSGALGRLVSIPVSVYISPQSLLLINCTLMSAGFIVILALVDQYSMLMWVSVALIGFGCATTFPSTLLYAAQFVDIEGRSMSCFLTVGGIGAVIGPLLVGYLIDVYHANWLIYIGLIATVTFTLLLGVSYMTMLRRKIPRREVTIELKS